MTGCSVGDWLVLFGTDRSGTSVVSYAFGEESRRHLLLGLVPNSAYDVAVNGEHRARVTSSSRGSVRLDAEGGGRIEIGPAAANEVADTPPSVDAPTS